MLTEAVLVDVDVAGPSNRPGVNGTLLKICINLYGVRASLQEVGEILSTGKRFLQHPYTFREDCVYDNPHYFRDEDCDIDLSNIPALPKNALIEEAATAEVKDILNSLDVEDLGQTVSLSTKLRTELLR